MNDKGSATDSAEDFDTRKVLANLKDIEDIKRIKYAYLRCLDQKDWDGMVELLAPDATAAYSAGKYSFDGRVEIIDFVSRNMSRDGFHSSHKVHHPEIDIDGDRASATWALEDTVIDSEW
ncbi:MAG TPA: nuclear transport factor 2 family protein, partial [Microthrixaceae bacterium]|nr:nuclear transport factor 2 family protein [Microthrixaceae bacterium]